MRQALILWCLFALALLVFADTRYENDARQTILLRQLSLRKGSALTVTITDTSFASYDPTHSEQSTFNMAAFITNVEYPGYGCYHKDLAEQADPDVNANLRMLPLSLQSSWKSVSTELRVVEPEAALYVYFSNCEPMSTASFTVHFQVSVPHGHPSTDALLFFLYGIAAAYFVLGVSWIVLIWGRRSNHRKFHAIFTVALLVKFVLVVTAAKRRHIDVQWDRFGGIFPEELALPTLEVVVPFFLVFFSVIALSLLDRNFSPRLFALVQGALYVQLLASTSGAITAISSVSLAKAWTLAMFIINCVAGVVVLCALTIVMTQLWSESSAKTSTTFGALARFSLLYMTAYLYSILVFCTKAEWFMHKSLLTHAVQVFLRELALLVLFALAVCVGLPQVESQYRAIGTNDDIEVQMVELRSRSDNTAEI